MTRDQHIALGEAISELCNPDAGWTDRSNAAQALRKAFSLPADHKDGCACEHPDLDPEDIGHACDCGFWDAIYPADMAPAKTPLAELLGEQLRSGTDELD